jgi:hypothetical protein
MLNQVLDSEKVCEFYGMFTVHFYKIENNDIQQMHFNTFIRYTNTPTCLGHSGPSSGSYLFYFVFIIIIIIIIIIIYCLVLIHYRISNDKTICCHYKTWSIDKYNKINK